MYSDGESFYDGQTKTSGVVLGQMNNKSSVLCPETQDITSQFLVLQQLNAHQKMISRAKGCVDTSAPKSMKSYKSLTSEKKKKNFQQSQGLFSSSPPNKEEKSPSPDFEDENESVSMNPSLIHKAIQAGIPVSNFNSTTAEKIAWYLEAIKLGELQSQFFSLMYPVPNMHTANTYINQRKKHIIKGDIMDRHKEHFKLPKAPFSPRILADQKAKSKVKEMRCYNPPFRKKKTNSSHSSDTFESYDEEEDEEDSNANDSYIASDNSSVEDKTHNQKAQSDHSSHIRSRNSFHHFKKIHYSDYNSSRILCKSEEDKYLEFLSKVTEDILRKGIYTDKAIEQAFEFHMQFYKDESNEGKLQSLLEQVLEGLKISNDESEDNFCKLQSSLFSGSESSHKRRTVADGTFNSSSENMSSHSKPKKEIEENSTVNDS